MGRPMFPYEAADQDFSWILSTFQEENPYYITVEVGCLPVVLIPQTDHFQEFQPKEIINDELIMQELLGDKNILNSNK